MWVFLYTAKINWFSRSTCNSFSLQRSDSWFYYLSPVYNSYFVLAKWLHLQQVPVQSSHSPSLKQNTSPSLWAAPFSVSINYTPVCPGSSSAHSICKDMTAHLGLTKSLFTIIITSSLGTQSQFRLPKWTNKTVGGKSFLATAWT